MIESEKYVNYIVRDQKSMETVKDGAQWSYLEQRDKQTRHLLSLFSLF